MPPFVQLFVVRARARKGQRGGGKEAKIGEDNERRERERETQIKSDKVRQRTWRACWVNADRISSWPVHALPLRIYASVPAGTPYYTRPTCAIPLDTWNFFFLLLFSLPLTRISFWINDTLQTPNFSIL